MGKKRSEINSLGDQPWGPRDLLETEADFFASLTN